MQADKVSNSQQLIALGTTAALIVSCVSLYFYWQPFGVNIFSYLSISEILTRSALPLLLTSSTFIGALFAQLKTSRHGEGTNEASFQKKFRSELILSTALISLGTLGLYLNEFKSISAITTGVLLITFTTKKLHEVIDYIGQISGLPHSLTISFLIIVVLSASYSLGSAMNIKNGSRYQIAEISTKEIHIKGAYIGRSESEIFIWDRDLETLRIIEQASINTIELKESKP